MGSLPEMIQRIPPYEQSFLDRGGEKEALPESRQSFEVAAARTSELVSLVLLLSNWVFVRNHSFICS